jgi:putative MFS transporter
VLKTFTSGSQVLADVGAAAISILGVLGAAIGLGLVDRWGRRPLMLWAFGGLTLVLAILASVPTPALGLLVALFGLAELFANMGPGVLDFVYPTELFPAGVRAGATGLFTAVSRVGAILGIVVFPGLVKAWGLGNALWLFAAASLLGLVVSAILAPETRGRSLEEISEGSGRSAGMDEPVVARL